MWFVRVGRHDQVLWLINQLIKFGHQSLNVFFIIHAGVSGTIYVPVCYHENWIMEKQQINYGVVGDPILILHTILIYTIYTHSLLLIYTQI